MEGTKVNRGNIQHVSRAALNQVKERPRGDEKDAKKTAKGEVRGEN